MHKAEEQLNVEHWALWKLPSFLNTVHIHLKLPVQMTCIEEAFFRLFELGFSRFSTKSMKVVTQRSYLV